MANGRLRRVRAVGRAASLAVRRLWAQVDRGDIAGSWRRLTPAAGAAVILGQDSVAEGAEKYLLTLLDTYGLEDDARAEFRPESLSGVASDGRNLLTLMYQPAISALSVIKEGGTPAQGLASGRFTADMIVRTQVSDAARVADGVALAVRPQLQGWVRMLSLPSCSRCILLAGRVYRWNEGFKRHPRCDCRHIPAPEDVLGDLRTDPRAAFDSMTAEEQNKAFTQAGAEAIRDGADISQVVNARRGMRSVEIAGARRLITTEGTVRGQARGRRTRLMPEQIYLEANGNRSEAIRLLRIHGYVR